MLRSLLNPIDESTRRKYDELLQAAKDNNVDTLRVFLANSLNAPEEVRSKHRQTLLHVAAFEGNVETVELLLQSRRMLTKLNSCDHGRRTALHLAAAIGSEVCARKLVEAGAQMDPQDEAKRTPLQLAIRWEQVAAARALLELLADPTIKDVQGQNALELVNNSWGDEIGSLADALHEPRLRRSAPASLLRRCLMPKRRNTASKDSQESGSRKDSVSRESSVSSASGERTPTAQELQRNDLIEDSRGYPRAVSACRDHKIEHAPAAKASVSGIELDEIDFDADDNDEEHPPPPPRDEVPSSPISVLNILGESTNWETDAAMESERLNNTGNAAKSQDLLCSVIAEAARKQMREKNHPALASSSSAKQCNGSAQSKLEGELGPSAARTTDDITGRGTGHARQQNSKHRSSSAPLKATDKQARDNAADVRDVSGTGGSTNMFHLAVFFHEGVQQLGFGMEWYEEPRISNVTPGGEAAARGLAIGDHIVDISGTSTLGRCRDELLPLLKVRPLRLRVRRAAHASDQHQPHIELNLTLDAAAEGASKGSAPLEVTMCGMFPVVYAVRPDGEAAAAGVLEGDAILNANGRCLRQVARSVLTSTIKERPLAMTLWRRPIGSELFAPWTAAD